MLSTLFRLAVRILRTSRTRGILVAVTAAGLTMAAAQQCTYEVEPNDTPAEATLVTGVGPDGAGTAVNARLGTVCLAGDIGKGDQDAFWWEVDELAAAHEWTARLEGVSGQLNRFSLHKIEFADNGVDVTAAEQLFTFASPDGSPTVSEPFLIEPGRYMIAISVSGGEGQYVVNLVPQQLSYRASQLGATVRRGEFRAYGPVDGESELPFEVVADDAGFAWGLRLEAAIGTSLRLTLEGPDGVIGSPATAAGAPARLDGYGLEPGVYTVRITGDSGVARFTTVKQGRRGDGQEVEPNNSEFTATRFPLGTSMRGHASDADWFMTPVSGSDAVEAWDLVIEAEGVLDVRLRDSNSKDLFLRRLSSGVIPALHLSEGYYSVGVSYRGEPVDYELTWRPAEPQPANHNELEPNDTLFTATDIGAQAEARGNLTVGDVDFFRFEVEGQAQLYRVQAVGQGVTRVTVYTGGGSLIAQERGSGRIRLDDLLLLPGAQYFSVEGEGEYAVRAMALGPAPAPEPPAAMPTPDTPLTSSPAGPPDPTGEVVGTEPLVVESPVVMPPPPGLLEYEPNDDRSRAHKLVPGAVHVGRLGSTSDEDYYRFYLAGDQLVRLELVPPEGVTGLMFELEGEGSFSQISDAEGESIVMERWLLAGDHSVRLRGYRQSEAPAGYYQLRLLLLGVLDLPVDLEPNDNMATAAKLPSELAWSGVVGEMSDYDLFALPVFDDEVEVTLWLRGGDNVGAYLRDEAGSDRWNLNDDGSLGTVHPAGQQRYLELRGSGPYEVVLEFSKQPDAAQLLPPRNAESVSVTLDSATSELTAFWHEGQLVEATATVRNDSAATQTVQLQGASNDARVRVTLPEAVHLQPGESTQVPVTLEVPAGARDDVPLYLQVVANGAAGSASARRDFVLVCEAPPVNPFPYHSLPAGLLGKPDALWSGFGAGIHGDDSYARRDVMLIDGRTSVSYGGVLTEDHHPTFELAGDEPVTILGTSLHPQAGVGRGSQLRRFRMESSLDGVTFSPIFEGELQAARFEQVFEFDAPVKARYVRLVPLDDMLGRPEHGYVGEWKVYAQEAERFSGLNLADPDLGGHVVWSEPMLGSNILVPDRRTGRSDVRQYDGLTFAIGFQHARAALVSQLVWTESEAGLAAADGRVEYVIVEASVSGAAGPWEVVAEWQLERDAGGVARLQFEEPVWARYLRFTVPKGENTHLYEPGLIAVYEAAVGESGYLSILGEWGNMTRESAYELLVEAGPSSSGSRVAGNGSRQTAHQLLSGVTTSGTVSIGENEAWYKIVVGGGQNHVELRLGGDPAIAYAYELTDSTGRNVVYDERNAGDDKVLSFFAEPGDYFLRLSEPKRTVIFSWDTSGSVGPYTAITYSSLAEFSRAVDGEREAVQLLAYNDPGPDWLLPFWSSDPLRVQRAIQEYDRRGDSSNTEVALLTATLALADREGTKAILLITDAESGGAALTPALWRALEDVRPRVFTFEISSAGSDYAQDMMQDYAAVNGGYYDMTDGVGDFDAGFSRASCMLRRPKGYEVEVALSTVAPPGPGLLKVVLAEGAGRPAVEVIFDASGSMGQVLPSGEQRIVAAKRALETLVGEVLPDETPFALRAFGHIKPTSCDTRLDLALAPLDRSKALAAVRAIEPKLLSGTPIAESLAAVAQDLAAAAGARQVILITDGEESCGGDPAEAVRQLRAGGPLSLAIVSLALEPEALAVFESLAEEVGASYVDVGSYEALSTAIAEALNPAFEVYDQDGTLVAQGRVGGEAIELPMGLYRVRVLSAPVEVFDNVKVPGDGEVTVSAGR